MRPSVGVGRTDHCGESTPYLKWPFFFKRKGNRLKAQGEYKRNDAQRVPPGKEILKSCRNRVDTPRAVYDYAVEYVPL